MTDQDTELATLRAERDALKQEVERLKKARTGSAVERLHNLCDGFEEMDDRREAQLTALRSRLSRVEDAAKKVVAVCPVLPQDQKLGRAVSALESILSESQP